MIPTSSYLFPDSESVAMVALSECGLYRYSLRYRWNSSKPILGMVLLNPSKATDVQDDPTAMRQRTRAHLLGFGGIVLCNAFGLISTDPNELYSSVDPIGPQNDEYILNELVGCPLVIVGWGVHGSYRRRDESVYKLLRRGKHKPIEPQALRINVDKTPAHPLYLPYSLKPVPYVRQEWE
jgi:hypothetical protein